MTLHHTLPDLEALLQFLKSSRGFDFTGYKRTTLVRRIQKRMQTVGVKEYNDYIDYLEVHPEEFTLLFNSILINVTSFFRDEKAWEYIEKEVIPRMMQRKRPTDPIRIWSAGCATGEETYTIAMVLAEHLGLERFREQVKIYSTDLDDEALGKARQASYTESELESVRPELVEKYFDRSNGRYTFNKELRRLVIFGRHDLIQDAPISRIDLLLCRNVLMYFNAEAQTRILARLNYALTEHGVLFLGKAEMLLTHLNMFSPLNLKHRIFRKAGNLALRERLMVMNNDTEETSPLDTQLSRLREEVFETMPLAQVVLDMAGSVCMTNLKSREMFNLDPRDVGRPFQDLEISYRPVELRSSIEQAYAHGAPVSLDNVEYTGRDGDLRYLNILLTPLQNGSGFLGISISFQEVTESRSLHLQLEQANQELETAMEELQSTNEELETTNEELQSTIEELETTNEELQSTNEELETMNEELQSTNEELETMNDEMSQRSEELNQVNGFLETILTSLHGGVVVMDNELNIQIWNAKAEDLWGLREKETLGHNLFSLDFGLPLEEIRKPLRDVLSGEIPAFETSIPATNRRGRNIECLLTCTPLANGQKEIRGAILLMEQR